MARSKALKSFYDSKAWKTTRDAYASSVNNLCERCMSRGLVVPGSIVHHKIKLTDNNKDDVNISLNWNNLELVCLDCHNRDEFMEHGESHKRYSFGLDGEIRERKPRAGAPKK